jgi:hypothetical protein
LKGLEKLKDNSLSDLVVNLKALQEKAAASPERLHFIDEKPSSVEPKKS